MRRRFMGWLLGIGGNAIVLILASLVLGDMFTVNGVTGFVVSLVVFAILSALFTWLMFRTLDEVPGGWA